MKPQELVDMLLAVCGESFQFDCNTALDAVDVVQNLMDDLDALNLALKANKEMLAAETARADKAEQQRDELLKSLKWALPKIMREPCKWCREEDIDAHDAALALVASIEGDK